MSVIEPTARAVTRYINPGDAAVINTRQKLREYRHWSVDSGDNAFQVISAETSGAFSAASKSFIVGICFDEDNVNKQQLLFQRISCAHRKLIARMRYIAREFFSEDAVPYPIINNELPDARERLRRRFVNFENLPFHRGVIQQAADRFNRRRT